MVRVLRWSSIAGFTLVSVYFWQRGDWEIALTSIILPLLVGLVPLLFQKGTSDETRTSWQKSFFGPINFKKQYFTLLRYQNRDFDIKGLSTQTEHTLELDQVFVELKLQSQAAHKATADPLQNIPSKFRADSYPIWRFFSLLSDEKSQNPKLVIVGPPGSGKTTLLRHIALLLTLSPRSNEYKKAKINKVPILLFLRDHINNIVSNPSIMLPTIIESNIQKWDIAVTPNWFSNRLKKGECLVLLDGLDEVAEPAARRKMVAWLEKQILAYPKNAFIITSRPHGYKENPITGVSVLEVMPFNRSQIDSFVQKWYLANEIKSHTTDDPGVRMIAKSGADDLLRRLEKTPTLMELAVNPLLLTMIATVHRYRSALPGRRVELYKEICEVFLGKRQVSKGLLIDMVPAQKQSVLQSLAYEMMCGNTREIRSSDAMEIIRPSLLLVAPTLSPETFLKSIEQQTGLLLERELGVYSFAHKTFQEYLTSMFILEKNIEDQLHDRINDDWWHEVIKLYSAQTDATDLIITCLDQDPPSAVALSLAIQCLEEAHKVKPELREITRRILLENAEDEDPEIRTIIGQALLSNRLKHLSALSPTIFVDANLVTNAEYQVFIDDMLWRDNGDYYPVHWSQKSFQPGTAHKPVVGLTPEDSLAFCQWLTELHAGSGEWYFRLPVKTEIIDEKHSKLPGFWVLSEIDSRSADGFVNIEIWKNQSLPWPVIPAYFIKKAVEEDIKNIISILLDENVKIRVLGFEAYFHLNNILKRILHSALKPEKLLLETADELYKKIVQLPSSKGVNFGYGTLDLEVYDQTISDNIERIANKNFELGIMDSLKCFSDLVHSNPRASGRYRSIYVAFAFELLIKWIEKNKKFYVTLNKKGLLNKIDFALNWYMDSLIAFARQRKVVEPFEGLLIVKEIKERHTA